MRLGTSFPMSSLAPRRMKRRLRVAPRSAAHDRPEIVGAGIVLARDEDGFPYSMIASDETCSDRFLDGLLRIAARLRAPRPAASLAIPPLRALAPQR